ncbi:MAG: cbb3-type cytochrome oxidase assembly protein CcoS [Pseudomonadales bacterium]
MEILFLLIPLSLLLLGISARIFIWAVNNDQFEDLDRCALEALEDHTTTKGDTAHD